MIGAIAGAGASAVTGLAQLISGAIQKKQGEKKLPGMEDAEERASLESAKQQARSAYAGSDATTAASMRAINQGARNTQRAIARNTGGDVGSTISGMLQAQRTAGAQSNQALGQAAQRGTYFQGLGEQIRQNISQRKLELGMYKAGQDFAESAANRQSGFQNLAQGGMSLLGMLGQGGEQPATQNPVPDLGYNQALNYHDVSSPPKMTPIAPPTQIENAPATTGGEILPSSLPSMYGGVMQSPSGNNTATDSYGKEVDMSNVDRPSMMDYTVQTSMVRPQGY